MEKIINDLKVALDGINAKSKDFAEKSAKLDFLIDEAKKKNEQLDARDAFILEKEALHADYDAIDILRAEIKADKVAISKEKSAIDVEKARLADELSACEEERVELETLITLYKQKIADCNAKVAQLAEDKKNLEKKVVEELTKKLAGK